MKLPPHFVMKAAAKRVRAKEGPSAEQQAPAPKRLVVRAPQQAKQRPPASPEAQPPAPQEVDLTADTPPGEVGAEGPTVEPFVPTEAEPGPGEGPSEPRPPPGTPTRGPVQPASEADKDTGRDRVRSASPVASLFSDGRRAERLISHAIQPDYMDELRHLAASAFFREAFSGLVRATNSLAVTRDIINKGEDAIKQARRDTEEARVRAEAAERALEAALNDHAIAAKEAQNRAETEADRLRAALNQLGEAESAALARDLRIGELESAVQEADARAARAEEEAASKVRETGAAADARVAGAIEEFLGSERFGEEVAEATGDAYLLGFQHGKEKVARVHNFPQALGVEPDCAPEGNGDDEPASASS